ncbi:hypothetical protein NKH84_20380 [Mesorhizobium sp. M0902]|uniref:hypothetical protein n=1 Tax=Mesorhizobium sp. M0902 TaxID=2957021 RepID=UPI00333A0939
MASLEAEQKQNALEGGIHITGKAEALENRNFNIPVGVRPVALNLDFATDDPAVSLNVSGYPARERSRCPIESCRPTRA